MPYLALALLFASLQDPAPRPEFRRALALTNIMEDALPQGTQVIVATDLKGRCREDGLDVLVLHKGKRIPTWWRRGELWFRAAAEIPKGGRDPDYEIRYGGPAAPSQAGEVFEFFDTFEGATIDGARWRVDEDLRFAIDKGELAVSAIPAGRTEQGPSRLTLKTAAIPRAFVVAVEVDVEPSRTGIFSFAVCVEMKDDIAVTPAIRTRIAGLVEKLGNEELEARESATKELIGLGRAARSDLRTAARSSADLEVRRRASLALSQINTAEPPPSIAAGVKSGDGRTAALTRFVRMGTSRGELREGLDPSAPFQILIARDEEGTVNVWWSKSKGERGRVQGEVEEISLAFWAPAGGSIKKLSLDNVRLRRFVDEFPRAEIGPEEPIR